MAMLLAVFFAASLRALQVCCDEGQEVLHLERLREKIIGTGLSGHPLRVSMG